jgi:hypothetical protein
MIGNSILLIIYSGKEVETFGFIFPDFYFYTRKITRTTKLIFINSRPNLPAGIIKSKEKKRRESFNAYLGLIRVRFGANRISPFPSPRHPINRRIADSAINAHRRILAFSFFS